MGDSVFPPVDVVSTGKLATDVLKFAGRKIVSSAAVKVLLAIPKGEYKRIMAENALQRAYRDFIDVMDTIAKERRYECKSDELSPDCPMAFVVPQFYQEGRTTDGTAPLRGYTIIGDDGEVLNIQGFDLSQRLMITVRHNNGKVHSENVNPRDAMMVLRWMAGVDK